MIDDEYTRYKARGHDDGLDSSVRALVQFGGVVLLVGLAVGFLIGWLVF